MAVPTTQLLPLGADCVEKLRFLDGCGILRKSDLHNRSVFNDCYLGNIKQTTKNWPKNRLMSISTESAQNGTQ